MRLVIFPQDAIEESRRQEGEDPDSGIAPVETFAVDVEWEPPTDGPESVELTPYTATEGSTRLGRVPCEALHWMLRHIVTSEWWLEEPEVIIEELTRSGHFVDAAGFGKVMAMRALLLAPNDENPFYRNWYTFLFLTTLLLGRPLRWGELSVPTPVEMGLAMHIASELRPLPFHDEVLGTIAGGCLHHGLWCLPDILGQAQDAMLHQLAYHRYAVTEEHVGDVRTRLMSSRSLGIISDDLPDPDEAGLDDKEELLRIQTIKAMDTLERLEELHERGQQAQDLVFDRYQEKS